MAGRAAVSVLLLFAAGATSNALAAMAQSPLFLASQLKPNIIFTLDDSGSMNYEYLPDTAGYSTFGTISSTSLSVAKFRSSSLNGVFYNPAVRYRPWQKEDGTYYADSTPSAALDDPRSSGTTNLVNTSNYPDRYLAFYYVYNGAGVGSIGNFTRKAIYGSGPYDKAAGRTDCAGSTCTYAEEITNFANWYTYYRKRTFTAIAGISQAFNDLDGNYRIGYGRINSGAKTVDGVSSNTVRLGVRDFTGADRSTWFTELFTAPASGYTPLRRAMDDVGRYYSRSDTKGPWAENPGVSKGTEYACRKCFHILMTDGYWNSTAAYTTGTSDGDSTNGPIIDGAVRYVAATAGSYYNLSASNTLADVAMYYWKNDLRADLANKVPVSTTDPAFWQHITQYTVGLGLSGTLTYPTDEVALKAGTKTWPDPNGGDNLQAVDDLWHAAVNGHGLYFNAKNPEEFRASLVAALTDIQMQTGAASGVSTSADRVDSGTMAYVPSFQSGTWLGHLSAFALDSNGDMAATASWDAASLLPAWSSRNILTWNGTAGVTFAWDNLTTDQKAYLVSEEILNYIRGKGDLEKANSGGIYRNRATKLGDIVDSTPLHVVGADRAYSLIPPANGGGSAYTSFVATKAARTPMLYVGANDGMMHGFNATTGVELFAFIPNSVYANLKSLSSTDYSHKYFVDGQMTEGDAYLGGYWKNILLGSTGAGAKSIFAVDITDPASVTAGSIMWEKTSAGDADMGYVRGQIGSERMMNDDWAAIHGNGYESTNLKAVLYIRNIATGAVIKKIDTGVGGTSAPNGLSAPVFVRDSARRVIAAYAGDLQGNLWKFDLSDASPDNWKVAYSGVPLFVAKNSSLQLQPITEMPSIAEHPKGGYIFVFGTGKYYETSDMTTTQVQSLYGIWDPTSGSAVTTGRSALVEQTQNLTSDGASLTNNMVNWGTQRGWFSDFVNSGERSVTDSKIEGDVVRLNSITPSSDPCATGGDSQRFKFKYLNGGAVQVDANGDGVIDSAGIKVSGTLSPSASIRVGNQTVYYDNNLDGTITKTLGPVSGAPFRTWRVLPQSY